MRKDVGATFQARQAAWQTPASDFFPDQAAGVAPELRRPVEVSHPLSTLDSDAVMTSPSTSRQACSDHEHCGHCVQSEYRGRYGSTLRNRPTILSAPTYPSPTSSSQSPLSTLRSSPFRRHRFRVLTSNVCTPLRR